MLARIQTGMLSCVIGGACAVIVSAAPRLEATHVLAAAVATDAPDERPVAVPMPGEPNESPSSPASVKDGQATKTEGEDSKEDAEKKDAKDDEKDESKNGDDKPAPPVLPEDEGFDILPGASFDTTAAPDLRPALRAIRTAQVHLRLGAAEHGNVAAYDAARRNLDDADRKLASVAKHDADGIRKLIAGLKTELDELRSTSSATFFGRFPLVRAFGLELEDNEEFEVRSYSPPGEGLRRGVRNALVQIGKSASSVPLDVLVLVPGESAAERQASALARLVDSESHGAFASVANLKPFPGSLRDAVDPMPAWNAPDRAFDPLCRQFLKATKFDASPRNIMLVLVRAFADEQGDGLWVQAQQRTYEASSLDKADGSPEKLEADKVRVGEALTHDRSHYRWEILAGIAGLFLAALLVHQLLAWTSGFPSSGWQRWGAIPAAGFLIGFVLPPLIMIAFQEWLPDPQTSALSAAWWPCTAGALTLILPAGVFRLGAGGAGKYFPSLSCHGRWGVAFVPVALGVCAAWIRPAAYALGLPAIPFVIVLGVAAAFLNYGFGRAVDPADQYPEGLTPVALLLALVFGIGAFLGSIGVLCLVACAAAGMSVLSMWLSKRRTLAAHQVEDAAASGFGTPQRRPRTLEQLRLAIDAPRYQPPPEFETLRKSLVDLSGTGSNWIGLVGPSAAGKTAAARQLIGELQSSHADVQVLVGKCDEDATLYQPIREALAELGLSAGFASARAQGGEVNNIFERLADEFIPFWDFFSHGGDEADEERTRNDLLAAVTNALHAVMQQSGVILFLDDVQWIDEGSAAVVRHLRENFVPNRASPFLIILASRSPDALEKLGLNEGIVSLTPPAKTEQVGILEHSLGIEPSAARQIVGALGVLGQESGGMFWLLRSIRELVSANAFAPSPRGFVLRAPYLKTGRLPVPAAMRAKLRESLQASGEFLPVLECAALIGERFRVDDLAEVLGIDRLKLLRILRQLEREHQLLRDLPGDEDGYAFSSRYLLEIVREDLEVGKGESASRRYPSKLARELHGRIALVLSRRTPRTPRLAMAIAEHFCAAGAAYAPQCVEHCLASEQVARKRQQMDDARHFAAMAQRAARAANRVIDAPEEKQQPSFDEPRPPQTERSPHLSA